MPDFLAGWSLQGQHDAIAVEEEDRVQDYLDLMQSAADVGCDLQRLVQDYRRAVPFLQPGRLVQLLSHIPGGPPGPA